MLTMSSSLIFFYQKSGIHASNDKDTLNRTTTNEITALIVTHLTDTKFKYWQEVKRW